jgi:hypothetical protein
MLRGLASCRDVAEEAQGIRLETTLLRLTDERQRMLSKSVRLLQMASEHLRLPEGKMTASPVTHSAYRLREQRHGVGDAPGQGVCCAQVRSQQGKKERKARVLTEAHGPLEEGEGPVQVTLTEG